MSLDTALASRRCVRSFSEDPLSAEQVRQLLWAAQGVSGADTVSSATRTAPSAGALQPLEMYVIEDSAVRGYSPESGTLDEPARPVDEEAFADAVSQEFVGGAPVVVVIAADEERTASKYGDRAGRYVLMEAGHAAQNVLLEAVSLGLGATPVGAFDDEGVKSALGLEQEIDVIYLIPVGIPR